MQIAVAPASHELLIPKSPLASSERVAIVLAILIFSALSIWGAISSEGFLEADGCTHYLYARFAFQEPHYFVNVWGRPICTAIYSIPAMLGGRLGVRVMSLILALACAGVTYAIARRQGYRHPSLAFLFTLAQPLVFLHSFSELTELPFATLLALAFWAYQSRRWGVMAILIALSPASRPEGFGFLVLAAIALVAHRRWWWLLVLPLPLMGWSFLGWHIWGHPKEYPWWMWLAHEWPYAAESAYEPGSLAHFAMLLPAVASPLIFPAMLIGGWKSLCIYASPLYSGERLGEGPSFGSGEEKSPSPNLSPEYRGEASEADPHLRRCQFLIAIIPLLILVGHSILYWRGKMASSGELRYMLVVAPFWALLAAQGWDWIFAKLEWKHVLRWAGAAAMLPVLINCKFAIAGHTVGYRVLPLTLAEDWKQARRVVHWYQRSGIDRDYLYVMASHPGIFYFLDRSPSGRESREWNKTSVIHPPAETLLIWDPMYAVYNADSNRVVDQDSIAQSDWTHVATVNDLGIWPDGFLAHEAWLTFRNREDWQIFVSGKPPIKEYDSLTSD